MAHRLWKSHAMWWITVPSGQSQRQCTLNGGIACMPESTSEGEYLSSSCFSSLALFLDWFCLLQALGCSKKLKKGRSRLHFKKSITLHQRLTMSINNWMSCIPTVPAFFRIFWQRIIVWKLGREGGEEIKVKTLKDWSVWPIAICPSACKDHRLAQVFFYSGYLNKS